MLHVDAGVECYKVKWLGQDGHPQEKTISATDGDDEGYLFMAFGEIYMLRVADDGLDVENVCDLICDVEIVNVGAYNGWQISCIRGSDSEIITILHIHGHPGNVMYTNLYVIELTKDGLWEMLQSCHWGEDGKSHHNCTAIYNPSTNVLLTNGNTDDDIPNERVYSGLSDLDYDSYKYCDILNGKLLVLERKYHPHYRYGIIECDIEAGIDTVIFVPDTSATIESVRYLSQNVIEWYTVEYGTGWWDICEWTVYNMSDGSTYKIVG